jgi:asparagine synthase (glutamine-hydrolysing)
MCGIAGQFRPAQSVETAEIRAMCDQIRHRGPDDEGYHVDGGCGIGMRRLSIIDLSTGHQPISNEDGSLWVVFNGEIYNYQELRQDLIQRGHRYKTNSDTETLLHLYEEERESGLSKLRGMFAYAIWDARERSLFLARDRFGKKPLYYAVLPQGLYFGSELKCLRTAGVPLDIDEEALQLYLRFAYIPDPWTPYRAIRKLMPGCWMRYYSNGRTEQGQYWKLPAPAEQPSPDLAPATARRQLKEVFDESVKLRMIADVPLGAFLSGGIDSSSIVASMALQSSEPVKTFSVGFEGAPSELPYARMVAQKYRTEHHEIVVEPNSIDLISQIVHSFDEPFGDAAAIPTYMLSEFAVQHVKVVLTGDGGDEIFGGYQSFFDVEKYRWADRIPIPARHALAWLADRLPYSAYGKHFLRAIAKPTALDRYFEMNSMPHAVQQRLLNPAWIGFASLKDFLLPSGADVLTQALYFEATAKLTGDMLVKVDRTSMAKSLEVRCPLLDHKLAELAARFPHAWKMSKLGGKRIFIDALGDRLPHELLHRPKTGFSFPIKEWFRGPLRDFVWDHLTSRTFVDRNITSPDFTRELLIEHRSGRRDNSYWIYMLLMLELWFREYGRTVPAPSSELAAWVQ